MTARTTTPETAGRPWARWLHPWAAAVRMARRDAARHRVRTVLATALVALPMAALVGGTVLTQSTPPARHAALASIPDGAQAVITATAIPRHKPPFPQLPEGAPGPWVDDLGQVPASAAELAARLPAGNRLLPYWDSPDLLATSSLALAPGQQATAGAGALTGVDLALVESSTLREAELETLTLLVPELAAGRLPTDPTEAVVTTGLAQRLGVAVGDPVVWVAPPHTGWYSSDGRIGEVVEDTQRAYRISGLVDSDQAQAWAPADWLAELVTADPAGVGRHWLMVGDQPVTWEHARQINQLQAFAVSRHVLEHYPSADELYPVEVDPVAVLNQLVTIVLAGTVGSLLVLFLVTPAFTVATTQARRTLGLAAATGATPTDLRRIVTAQGLVIGLAGGLAGATVGALVGVLIRRTLEPDSAISFPWWILPVAVGIATLLGGLATLPPAWGASRLAPVDAVKDRRTAPRSTGSRWRGESIAGALLLAAAVGCAGLSLSLPLPTVGVGSAVSILMLLLTLLLAGGGITLTLRSFPGYAARLARRLPVTPRLALRDAATHRSRFLPAAAAVLVATAAAAFAAVLLGSGVANERDRVGEMVADGRIVLGAQVPVDAAFDRLVLTDTVERLAEELPVTGHEPVFAVDRDSEVHLAALPPADRACPEGSFPDTASSVTTGAPLHCVEWEKAYAPGLAVPWWLGMDVHIMGGDAMRASGLAGAEDAAAVLDRGGVVVNNAALLADDGTVRVAVSSQPLPSEADADRIVTLPGAFVRGFAPPLTVAPATARTLGVDEVYVGEYVVTAAELRRQDLDRARELVAEHTTLVRMTRPSYPYPWGGMGMLTPVALLTALAVAATTISVALARTQVLRDFATMHAVGATPRFLRRFTLTQAAVVLATGVPLGMLAGLALGTYQIAWNRRTGLGGAWLTVEPLWQVQAALLIGVVVAGLAGALAVARPPRFLIRRSLD